MKFSAVILFLILSFNTLYAVRPFVTDDARIVDKGQLEMEIWTEFIHEGNEWLLAQNIMTGYSFTNWLELIVGGNIGIDNHGEISITNPMIQSKLLIFEAPENGLPGLSLGFGYTANSGVGFQHFDGSSIFAMAHISSRLFEDLIFLHSNIGIAEEFLENGSKVIKPFWALGAEIETPVNDLKYVVEIYAGDPIDPVKPLYAIQTGIRWTKTDYIGFDFTTGYQPKTHGAFGKDYWAQVGFRLLFDAFTDNEEPGNPKGASGMFKNVFR